ncbi:hypothetical protein LCM4577_26705 [Mesorhizobium sp. LCM 4577]|nr:hypothetical protein LCM4577_26705 [Mesorhizobium sp. LCM 4577]
MAAGGNGHHMLDFDADVSVEKARTKDVDQLRKPNCFPPLYAQEGILRSLRECKSANVATWRCSLRKECKLSRFVGKISGNRKAYPFDLSKNVIRNFFSEVPTTWRIDHRVQQFDPLQYDRVHIKPFQSGISRNGEGAHKAFKKPAQPQTILVAAQN